MKLMNLFMVMLLLTGRAVLAETSSVTDREWLKQQENLSEQLRQHPDNSCSRSLRRKSTVILCPNQTASLSIIWSASRKRRIRKSQQKGRCTLSPSRYLKRG